MCVVLAAVGCHVVRQHSAASMKTLGAVLAGMLPSGASGSWPCGLLNTYRKIKWTAAAGQHALSLLNH